MSSHSIVDEASEVLGRLLLHTVSLTVGSVLSRGSISLPKRSPLSAQCKISPAGFCCRILFCAANVSGMSQIYQLEHRSKYRQLLRQPGKQARARVELHGKASEKLMSPLWRLV